MYEHNEDFEKLSVELKTDTTKVLADVQRYAKLTSWGPLNQICYTNTIQKGSPNDVFQGAGSLAWDLVRQDDGSFVKQPRRPRVRETDFRFFNNFYKSSSIWDLFQEMQDLLQLKILRFRAMNMMPACCLTMHHDNEVRAHVALKTDIDCFFVSKRKDIHHIPADNKVRVMDTRHVHTFVNASVDTRIHIVAGMDTYGMGK
tara:strand:- start:6297 stop:6899 length:603 start_codon:yes stop_codon:yes gene_type:complete